MREAKVREYLRDVRSGLLDEPDEREIYRRMRLTMPVNDHEVPRNTGLLFFSKDPTEWFRGARIEVVQFAADRAGDVQEERIFRGGLVDQLRDCLNYLANLSTVHLQKQPDRSQAHAWVSYPMRALRETVVNAVYHRGYDVDQPEPTKVYLYPSRIEVISYPGPVPGIEARHLVPNAEVRAAPARNRAYRRVPEGAQAGRGTALRIAPRCFRQWRQMDRRCRVSTSTSSAPTFRPRCPLTRNTRRLSALRDAAHLRALGEHMAALGRVESAWECNQSSEVLAAEMIGAFARRGELGRAQEVFNVFSAQVPDGPVPYVENRLIEAFVEAGEVDLARQRLLHGRPAVSGQDAVDAAILARRAGEYRSAHRYFERAGEAVYRDARALLEFAQTKMRLASDANRQRNRDFEPAVPYRSAGAPGARDPTRCGAGPPCLGMARSRAHAPRVAGAGERCRSSLCQGA